MAHVKTWVLIGTAALLGLALILWAIFSLGPAQAKSEVEFTSTEPASGVEVRVPDVRGTSALGATPFRSDLRLANGPHTYIASAPGYQAVTGEFVLDGSSSLQIKIPALVRQGGNIQVRSNAAAQVSLGDQPAQACEPNAWTSLGRFEPGTYTVHAATALGTQEKTVTVGAASNAQADFYWGSRLVVTVVPTDVLSATVTVDQAPYTAPRDYSYPDITVQPFVDVNAAAPGYLAWSDVAFLQPGQTTTVTVSLSAVTTTDDEIRAAYQHFWAVWIAGYTNLDSSAFSAVTTGDVLALHEKTISSLQSARRPNPAHVQD